MFISYLEKFNLLQIIAEDLSTFIRKDSSDPLAFSEENFNILKSGAYIKYNSYGDTYYSFLLHNVLYNVQYKGSKTVEISFYAKEYPDLTLSVFQDIKIQHLGMKAIDLQGMGISKEFWEKMKIIFLDYSKTNPNALFNFHGIDVDYKKGKRVRFLIKQKKRFIDNEAPSIFYKELLKLQKIEKISVATEILKKLNDALEYVVMPRLKDSIVDLKYLIKKEEDIINYFPFLPEALKDINLDNIKKIDFHKIWDTYKTNENKVKYLKGFSAIDQMIINLILMRFINVLISALNKKEITLPDFLTKYNIISGKFSNKYFKSSNLDDDDFSNRIETLRGEISRINIPLTLNKKILVQAMKNFLKFPKISSILKLKEGYSLQQIMNQVSDADLANYQPAIFRSISFTPKVSATEPLWQFPSTYLEYTQKGMEELLSARNLRYYKILKSNGITNFIFDGENLSFKLGK